MLHVWGVRVWNGNLAMEEEILHEGSMPGAVIYISEFQNKLAWEIRYICITPPRMNRSKTNKRNKGNGTGTNRLCKHAHYGL